MYGFWYPQNLNGNGSQRLHSNDIFGVRKVQGWSASYRGYKQDELYQEADIIVKGTINNTIPFTDHPNPELINHYTKITMNIDECLSGNWSGKHITLLQEGQPNNEAANHKLLQKDDECILFLYYGHDGNLYILGGPQGRYDVLKSEYAVVNHLENYVYEQTDGLNIIRPDKAKIIKQIDNFVLDAKNAVKKFNKSTKRR